MIDKCAQWPSVVRGNWTRLVMFLLYFRLFTFSDLYWVSLSVFSCTVLFVSISQVIGCEDRLRNDLYCVEWGVKLYSIQPSVSKSWVWGARREGLSRLEGLLAVVGLEVTTKGIRYKYLRWRQRVANFRDCSDKLASSDLLTNGVEIYWLTCCVMLSYLQYCSLFVILLVIVAMFFFAHSMVTIKPGWIPT